MVNLMYICRGNICRSPVAEQITRQNINGKRHCIDSAGLIEPPHHKMSWEMEIAMHMMGYKPRPHKPKKATREMLENQDIVLCMQPSYINEVVEICPELKGKVYGFADYAGMPHTKILDPNRVIKELDVPLLGTMPRFVRETAYIISGHVNPSDERAVMELHIRIVRDIEKCVRSAIRKTLNAYPNIPI